MMEIKKGFKFFHRKVVFKTKHHGAKLVPWKKIEFFWNMMMDAPRRLSRFLSERRSNGPPQRVFFLRQGFFLEEECLRAFKTLGLCVQEFQVGQEWDSTMASRLLTGLVEFLPDFLFSINHIGFDKSGWLTEILKESRLPAATWYVDNPDFIVRAYPENVSDWVAVFVWDKHYVSGLRDMGFPSVTYLPLAVDTRLFRPFRHPPVDRFGCHAAAFVGSTWTERVSQQLARYAGQPETLAYIEAAARDFQWSSSYKAVPQLLEIYPGFCDLPISAQVDLGPRSCGRPPGGTGWSGSTPSPQRVSKSSGIRPGPIFWPTPRPTAARLITTGNSPPFTSAPTSTSTSPACR